jgi:hypothetical protein
VAHPVAVVQSASEVRAGHSSLAVVDGRVFGWGGNAHAELGALAEPQRVPAAIPNTHRVTRLETAPSFNYTFVNEEAPPPSLEVASLSPGSLTLSWRAAPQTAVWIARIRPVTKPESPWGPLNTLAPTARTFTFKGLVGGRAYELLLTNTTTGTRVIIGVPKRMLRALGLPLVSVTPEAALSSALSLDGGLLTSRHLDAPAPAQRRASPQGRSSPSASAAAVSRQRDENCPGETAAQPGTKLPVCSEQTAGTTTATAKAGARAGSGTSR